MSTVEIETGTYIKRFAFWNPATWSIPKLYWDAWSQEQRLHAICRQLEKVIKYADYLGVNVDDIAARLKAIEEGQLDPVIEAAVEEWFEENEPEIISAIASLNEALPIANFNAENTVSDAFDAVSDDFAAVYEEIANINTALGKKIITVEDYGAIGDGATDSTNAIQEAIAKNPNCIIAFRGGHYIISNTIHCWGNRGGQEIDLGGSYIVWNGASESAEMFAIDRTDSLTSADYLYDYLYTNPKESEAKILNGTLIAGGCGIWAHAFHTIIDNVKILDATDTAIRLGNTSNHISLQAKITDCHIMRSGTETYWSEEASELHLDLRNAPCGIEVLDPDCNFSDININRYSVGIRLRSNGHTFENCHLTDEYKAQRATLADTASIVFDLYTPTAINTNMFDTCYFDNAKYCLWSNDSIRTTILISDGQYFNSGRQVLAGTTSFEAYMAKHIPYIKIDNFNVVPADGRCVFIPVRALFGGSGFQAFSIAHEQYVQNIYNLTDSAHQFYTANQNFDHGEMVCVIRPANELESGVNQCIGCLMLPGDTASRFNEVKIRLSDRNYLYYEGRIRYTGSNLTLEDEIEEGSSRARYSLYVGAYRSLTIDGNDVMIWPIFIHPNQNFSSTPIYMSLDCGNMNVLGFLNAGAARDWPWTVGSYVIQKDFS